MTGTPPPPPNKEGPYYYVVNQSQWDCIKAATPAGTSMVYDDAPVDNNGTAETPKWNCWVHFSFDPAKNTLTYTWVPGHEGPFIATWQELWDGISGVVTTCGGSYGGSS